MTNQEVVLSIPLWCDWDGHGGDAALQGLQLSIPLWCDWDIIAKGGGKA